MFIPGGMPTMYNPNAYELPKHVYRYNGPVYQYGQYVGTYYGETTAVTPDRAMYNLSFKARREMGTFPQDETVLLDGRYLAQIS